MAGNCEPCLRSIVPQLREIGATDEEIRGAIYTGQMVKERPFAIMREVADELAGMGFSETSDWQSCPSEEMEKDDNYKVMMLIAASAAMAANCEFCLNKVIPLEDVSIKRLKSFSPLFDVDIYESLRLGNVIDSRRLTGGTARPNVLKEIKKARRALGI